MSRSASSLIFFGVALGILFGLHFYIWARLIRDTHLPSPWRQLATGLLVVLGLASPLTMMLGRAYAPAQLKWLSWPGYIWMGLLLFFFFLLIAADLVRLFLYVGGGRVKDPERRIVLGRLAGGAVALIAGGLGAISLREGLRRVEVKAVAVTLPKLPPSMNGLTIVQLTDVHIGPTIGRAFIEDVVARTNALKPDLIAITGDLVDGSVERLRELAAPLGQLKAKHGVFFVTGNHEYYSGVEEWMAELARLGIRVLRNERVSIGDGAASFDLAGIDDHSARRAGGGHGADLPRALAGRDRSRALVLLAHQPKAIAEAVEHGVGLQLSGHTHGGQIWPWSYLVRLQQPYVRGLHQVGETQLYVSCGTGYWGPPMRLGAPAEVTHITLQAVKA